MSANEIPPYYIRDPSMDPQPDGYGGLAGFGFFASLTGQLMSGVGAYYGAQSQQAQLGSQASSMDFQASLADMNARRAENDAQDIYAAGDRERVGLTLQQGQDRGAARAEIGSSGTASGGRGSNAEALASQRFLQQLDALTLDANTVRAANAARTGAVNERNAALLGRTSASNLRDTARSMSPYASSTASLLSGGGTLASQWVYLNRYRGGR
jgi:hypothetical protein